MWNTDPVILVLCLLAFILFMGGVNLLQAAVIRQLRGGATYDAETIRFLGRELEQARLKVRDLRARLARRADDRSGDVGSEAYITRALELSRQKKPQAKA